MDGILHHVANEHEWVLEEGVNGGQCAHAPLTEAERNKPWLKKDSAAHSALAKIVLDKRFLNTIPCFINFRYSAAQPYKLYNCIQYILIECSFFLFRHTGFLESFHNHILMYAAKRQSYTLVFTDIC